MNYLKFEDYWQAYDNGASARYKLANQWFRPWRLRGITLPDVMNAWKMYKRGYNTTLPIVLGDEKLRADPSLIFSFGLASATGVQDKAQIELVKQAQKTRMTTRALEAFAAKTPNVLGPGAILSDQNWTPLINDALILGGIHARREFFFANNDFDGFQGASSLAAKFGPTVSQAKPRPESKWLAFLLHNPVQLWNAQDNCPRVFARELVGLAAFGYAPVFDTNQLGFVPMTRARATFHDYLDALRESGYTASDQSRLFRAISKFLFGNTETLYAKLPGKNVH